jgi:N-methylhydantoinase B
VSVAAGLDPVTYQVVRNRLLAITDEMRVALQSVSGSPTVTQASDFFTGLFRPDGTFISMGYQGTFASAPLAQLVRHIREDPDTTVRPGDVFISNDPFIAALHQNDVQMIAPIYEGDRLLAWAAVMAHETDVGGMDFASWSPKAREVFQEGLLIPAVKLIDRGEMRRDVLRMILAASRLPGALGLDIRAFAATLKVAGDRVRGVVARYGEATLAAAMDAMVAGTERRLRARLAELPDGVYRARDFLEHDGHENRLYLIDLVATKEGQELSLDFSATSPQAPGFINCTRAGLHGAVAGTILPTLAYDMSWNEGAMAPVEIIAPDGLLITAQHPAPVGAATVQAIWLTSGVVTLALNKMLAASRRYAFRAQGVSCGTMATFNMGGRNRRGEWFGFHALDSLASGSGAYMTKDGIHAGGPYHGPMPAIADVERNEQVTPMLYLYRRLCPDSSGHGRRRGGASAEIAFTLGGVEEVEALLMTYGQEVPNGQGLCGGGPGSQVWQRLGRRVFAERAFDSVAPGVDPAPLGGEWVELSPKPGLMPMRAGDVLALRWQGGGAIGDPLDRPPEAVLADVLDGIVSEALAGQVYGVVIRDGDVDAEATERRRAAIREERIGPERASLPRVAESAERWPLSDALELVRDGERWLLACKGRVLVSDTTAWRSAAVRRAYAMPPGNPPLHEDLELTAWYCPATATLLAVDMHRRGTDPPDDVLLRLESVSALARLSDTTEESHAPDHP